MAICFAKHNDIYKNHAGITIFHVCDPETGLITHGMLYRFNANTGAFEPAENGTKAELDAILLKEETNAISEYPLHPRSGPYL